MSTTVTQRRPAAKRVLTLPCGHSQPSAAKAGSTIDCQTCRHPWKVTHSIAAAAGAQPAPMPRQPRTVTASPARSPAGRWAPAPIARQEPDEQPGDCPHCGNHRSWAGRASMAWCDQHGADLAPRTLRAHTRAAGPQEHRGMAERDHDAEDLYRRVEALLAILDPLLDDPDLDATERGTIRYWHDELVTARREKNSARVDELADKAANLGDDLELDPGDVWELDDDDDGQDQAAETQAVSPAGTFELFATPASDVLPFRPRSTPGKRSRPGVSRRRKKQPTPRNWLLPHPAAPAVHPLLRDEASAGEWVRTAQQRLTAAGNGGSPAAIRALNAKLLYVHESFYGLARRDTSGQPRRSLLVRIVGAFHASQRCLPAWPTSDPAAEFCQRLDDSQAASWRATAIRS